MPSVHKSRYCSRNTSILVFIIVLVFIFVFGILTHPFELDYETEFSYPLKQNIVDCVAALRFHRKLDCPIINDYNNSFVVPNENKCQKGESIRLVLLIKSAINNVVRRNAIRQTWGFEDRFSDVTIKRVFFIGLDERNSTLTALLEEQRKYGDIVIINFLDSYFNNTRKTVNEFRWAVKYCPDAKFYLFSDDDMYISIKNVLKFVRNPTEYPQYLQTSNDSAVARYLNKGVEYDLPADARLLAGYVYFTAPHRHLCSKWYVSLSEYPYDKWPPYVSAGSYIASREALHQLYYGTFFTQHFRFDDIYVGLVARKIELELFHSEYFHLFQQTLTDYRYALSDHGYNAKELIELWNRQKSAGNA